MPTVDLEIDGVDVSCGINAKNGDITYVWHAAGQMWEFNLPGEALYIRNQYLKCWRYYRRCRDAREAVAWSTVYEEAEMAHRR